MSNRNLLLIGSGPGIGVAVASLFAQGDLRRVEEVLDQVAHFGALECVYFNAARVAPSALFEFPMSGIEEDFEVLHLSAHGKANTDSFHLGAAGTDCRPSFLVIVAYSPLVIVAYSPLLFALSMVKAAQANLVKSLGKVFTPEGVHVGLVVVGGAVSPSAPALNARNIADQA
ncbi:hypothetical protein CNMCM6106_003097 [Aspergillus hiratsukae]|uniref:Uncharacterized protein n=1 Tax=Aspergillus hiratsukae TaxID=1194566 RepID=A0A8H6Q772_9EURO|nr:hypothetical protein CNMCM6106_003097 [Aspergillus hiratsukae]